ncbi:MAG TPA: diguanylate cyclase [Candidatus Acidoferrales bacterium]|nr:diguanylate cyclase [Candidatus Acidoferrales bacterium]
MRVLVADDDEIYRGLLATTLAPWGYQVTPVSGGEQALECLAAENAPTLAILDWMMPGLSGPEVCARLRARPGARYTYVLLLTARHEMKDVIQGLDAGADDYLTKPFDTAELRARLRAAERILALQEKLLKSREELEELATHDPLTQLWNRRTILELLCSEAARAKREKTTLAVILVDVDHFKQVNDTRGHLCGDQVLCEVARRMDAALRPYDVLGRFGGEEFLVALTTDAPAGASVVAERLRAAVAAAPFAAGGVDFCITVSAGVATGPGGDDPSPESLLHAADSALYRAKHEGRNRVCVALTQPDPHPIAAGALAGSQTSATSSR